MGARLACLWALAVHAIAHATGALPRHSSAVRLVRGRPVLSRGSPASGARARALLATLGEGDAPLGLRRAAQVSDNGRFLLSRRLALLSTGWLLGLRPEAARSLDAYDAYAPSYDALDGGQAATRLGFDELRRSAVARARGDVLEVGVGTGLNLPMYDWSGVRSLVALDASQGMLSEARKRVLDLGVSSKVQLRQGDAASLPFADSSFDAVLDTYSLCVFADPESALREMRRVLKPDGIIICVEHQRAGGLLGAYQDATQPLVTPMSKGCVWNQDVRAIARKVGCREVSADEALLGTVISLVLRR
jgi:methyltransferase OMS1